MITPPFRTSRALVSSTFSTVTSRTDPSATPRSRCSPWRLIRSAFSSVTSNPSCVTVEQGGFLGVLRLNQYVRTKAACHLVPLLAFNSCNVRFFED
jgi:hypothetical protein